MSSKKKNDLNNSTKDNPYENYHGHQNSSGQNLSNSTNKDSNNSTGKDSKNKKNKNK